MKDMAFNLFAVLFKMIPNTGLDHLTFTPGLLDHLPSRLRNNNEELSLMHPGVAKRHGNSLWLVGAGSYKR